jgi:prepilin-type N-terminal cleavage/methylation domain-containing protein
MNMKHVKNRVCSAGFTLIELIVVVSILVIITTVMLANHARYGSSVILQNLAYDVALSIRQAQVYGISVARYGTTTESRFDRGFGMHFNSNATQYVLFADVFAQNGVYDSNEQVNISSITNGYRISDLCATLPGSNVETCGYSNLDILYLRPEPGALISAGSDGVTSCITVKNSCQENARIIISSSRGDTMGVTVWGNGQISVQQTITTVH